MNCKKTKEIAHGLKPCPFCGSKELTMYLNTRKKSIEGAVGCGSCGKIVYIGIFNSDFSRDEVIIFITNEWNRRKKKIGQKDEQQGRSKNRVSN